MTTRILSSGALPRVLRLVVALLLVVAVVGRTRPGVWWLVAPALAWFIVPQDRRWFVPVMLLPIAALLLRPWTILEYQLGDGSRVVVNRLTGVAEVLPPNRVRTDPTVGWYRRHPTGWVRLTRSPGPSLLAYLGITRPSSPPRAVASDSTAAGVPPVPADLAVKGGCLSLSGGQWVPCATLRPPAPPRRAPPPPPPQPQRQ